jgi:hypothetical protein
MMSIQRMKLTGAAILVSRGMAVLQATPGSLAERDASRESMFRLFKKQRDSGGFWAWLATNASRIQAAGGQAAGGIAVELSSAFKKAYPDLVWEITPNESGPWVFCVSADGNVELLNAER